MDKSGHRVTGHAYSLAPSLSFTPTDTYTYSHVYITIIVSYSLLVYKHTIKLQLHTEHNSNIVN